MIRAAPVWRPSSTIWACAAVVSLIWGTSLLPFAFPSREIVLGASTEVGFSNTIAYLVFVLTSIPCAVLVARLMPPGAPTTPVPGASGRLGPRLVVAAVCLAHVMLFAAIYLYRGRFVFAEGLYFQHPLYRIASGEVPLRDFSYYYGPSMIYPAAWLARVLSLDAAYGVWFVATYVGGLLLLAFALHTLLRDVRAATFWFVVIAVGLFNPWTGLNVTFVRFVLPTVTLLLVVRFAVDGGRAHFAVALAAVTVALTYVFEVAVIITLTAVLFAVLRIVGDLPAEIMRRIASALGVPSNIGMPASTSVPSARVQALRVLALLLAGAALAVASFAIIDPTLGALRLYPVTALSYTAGAYNEPISPHLPFLLLASATIVGAAGALRLTAGAKNQEATAFLLAYLGLVLVTERGAFAVGDSSHFANYGIPAILLCLYLSTRVSWGPLLRRWAVVGLVVGFAAPMQFYHLNQLVPAVSRVAAPRLAATSEPVPAAIGIPDALAGLARSAGTERPYLMFGMEYYSLPVYRDLRLRYATYFTFSEEATTPDAVARLVDDLRRTRPFVLIMEDRYYAARLPARYGGAWDALALLTGNQLPGSDMKAVLAYSEERMDRPILEYLRSDYRIVRASGGILLLEPRG